ncbi:NF-kappa-B inhibitor-like protein 1 isoform X5 [Myotis myotis]|uniref:NF-kappa-B inhibitor-like protein 1 isoform X5 n=1 Tax=Myotis myotis TaxID=51298 RepID=UPI00174B3562|nr:NF-kappa-B inhibitor-like protein 1 isoform X5 [Myotis myotis]
MTASPMASKARRRRRERRFRRYLSAGRLARAQALLQRHPGLDVDAGRPPPLHRACARHDAPALCLLLRLGADPARRDRHGNTALHAAARRGPGAYTDFFLPLLRRCPSAMGIKNKDGETPGQILGWGPPWDSAEEEEEDEASREHQWRQKLLGELEDEWQEVTGRLEGLPCHHRDSSPCGGGVAPPSSSWGCCWPCHLPPRGSLMLASQLRRLPISTPRSTSHKAPSNLLLTLLETPAPGTRCAGERARTAPSSAMASPCATTRCWSPPAASTSSTPRWSSRGRAAAPRPAPPPSTWRTRCSSSPPSTAPTCPSSALRSP